jgi:PIN domain nuclease of toxin-antitoxin system
MKSLLDSHLVPWRLPEPRRLPKEAHALLEDNWNTLLFSAASLWEIEI